MCNRYIRVIGDNLSAYKQALLVYYPQSSTKVDKAKFTRSPTLALRSSPPYRGDDSRPRSLAPRAAWIVTVHLRLSVLRYPSRATHAPHAQSLRLSFTAPNHSVASAACGSEDAAPSAWFALSHTSVRAQRLLTQPAIRKPSHHESLTKQAPSEWQSEVKPSGTARISIGRLMC